MFTKQDLRKFATKARRIRIWVNGNPAERAYHFALLLGLISLCSGCVIGQQWSENYALQQGVTASDPAFIDGKAETIGQSQRKKSSGSAITDLDIPSEAIIHLPEKRSIYRIVIHTTNLESFELQAFDSLGEWKEIYDRRTNKDRVIDIRLSKVVTTTGIKLVVKRTTDDAARRRENLKLRRENVETSDGQRRRGRYMYHLTGPTTALARIAEIELYGYAN